MQLWYELYSQKVHVLAPKVSWHQQPFFRQKLSKDESRNEYLANDEPMVAKPAPSKPVDESGKSKEPVKTGKLKRTKIKRGYGKKNRRKNEIKMVDLTLVGTNAAGIKSKIESFYHTINKFKPSIITIQETKQNKKKRPHKNARISNI